VSVRSWLYVPGDRPDRFDKAAASGAGAVVLDLEDAVPLAGKDAALAAVLDWCAGGPVPVQVWVRVNGGRRGADDVAAVARTVGELYPLYREPTRHAPQRLAQS